MTSLPSWYRPGKYRTLKADDGYYVLAPGGQRVSQMPHSSRAAAQSKADALNAIRIAMAPRKKAL